MPIIKGLSKEFTASEITEYAMKVLGLLGYKVWRNNNIGIKGRPFTGLRGVGDLTGYKRFTGVRMECEVKKIGDKLKPDQKEFLDEAKKNGCDVFLATQKGNEISVDRY